MEQPELLRHLIKTLESLGLSYFVTGSVASILYAEPRFTHDIDIVVDLPLSAVEPMLRAFPLPEYYLSREAMTEAIMNGSQFNIYHPASGLKVDVLIPSRDEFNASRFERRRRLQPLPDLDAWVASPEDVILKKLQYYAQGGSDKHLRDIASILKVSGEAIDLFYIDHWAARLDVAEVWTAVRRQIV